MTPREAGLSQQSWLWAAPAKHSPRQIEEVLEHLETLYEPGVHRHLVDVPDDLLRRYARRLTNRPPSIGARIKEPVRTIETALSNPATPSHAARAVGKGHLKGSMGTAGRPGSVTMRAKLGRMLRIQDSTCRVQGASIFIEKPSPSPVSITSGMCHHERRKVPS